MKFNKDTFLNHITSKVQSAIDKNLITAEDVQNENMPRLHSFIQFELFEYIEDRKFAIDVLRDFNYDEKTPWDTLRDQFGEFESLMDIALINLWKFLDSEGATTYAYYKHDNYDPSKTMLDMVHDMEHSPNEEVPRRDRNDEYHPEAPEADVEHAPQFEFPERENDDADDEGNHLKRRFHINRDRE